LEDLLIAVSEVVTNAIRYAEGVGSITVRRLAGGMLAEIRDNGPGLPGGMVAGRPTPEVPVGGGLWRARLLCRDFDLISSSRGVTVRIFTPCEGAR
jgi:anti-sigma regulatory factor (Ser/Thr protein kinase)